MIRAFGRGDLHTLHRMIRETIDTSYSGVYPPRAVRFFKEYHSEERIAERSATGEVLVLVSERDGSLLATGSLMGSEIVGVFVRSGHERRGYGYAMMTELERRARAKGLREVSLSVSLPSRRFYECLGYEVSDEYAIDVGEGEFLKYRQGRKVLRPEGASGGGE